MLTSVGASGIWYSLMLPMGLKIFCPPSKHSHVFSNWKPKEQLQISLPIRKRQKPKKSNTNYQSRLESVEPCSLSLWFSQVESQFHQTRSHLASISALPRSASEAGGPATDILLLGMSTCFKTQKTNSFQMSIHASWELLFMALMSQFGTNIKITNIINIQLCPWRGQAYTRG